LPGCGGFWRRLERGGARWIDVLVALAAMVAGLWSAAAGRERSEWYYSLVPGQLPCVPGASRDVARHDLWQ
jgi:hypothetical protein